MSSEGALILVVGPSGAGKDSILRGLRSAFANDRAVRFARRFITRLPDGNEDNLAITPTQFSAAREIGGFLLAWDAHGLSYGLPASIGIDLACGVSIVANVSRNVVDAARRLWPKTYVVLVTASPETLQERLAHRGRDGDAQLRLARVVPTDAFSPDIIVHNEGDIGSAILRLSEFLRSVVHASEQRTAHHAAV